MIACQKPIPGTHSAPALRRTATRRTIATAEAVVLIVQTATAIAVAAILEDSLYIVLPFLG